MIKVIKKVTEDYTKNAELIRRAFPGAAVLDITVAGAMAHLDPGHGIRKVAVPGMDGVHGLSLKGIWEGLKIFKNKNMTDGSWWLDERKSGKTRDFKSYGKLLGLRIGEKVVGLEKAKELFEQIYEEILQQRFERDLEGICKESQNRVVVLLDYAEGDPRKWLDHAHIIKRLIEGMSLENHLAA